MKRTPMPAPNKRLARTARLTRSAGLPRTERKRKPRRNTDPSPAMKEAVRKRDEHACARCGISITGRLHSIHHRVRRSQGGKNVPECLVTLCGDGLLGCHGWVHRNPAEARAFGWLLLGTDDPALEGVTYASEYGGETKLWLTRDGKRVAEDPLEAAA
jgi:hypothetical protein